MSKKVTITASSMLAIIVAILLVLFISGGND